MSALPESSNANYLPYVPWTSLANDLLLKDPTALCRMGSFERIYLHNSFFIYFFREFTRATRLLYFTSMNIKCPCPSAPLSTRNSFHLLPPVNKQMLGLLAGCRHVGEKKAG